MRRSEIKWQNPPPSVPKVPVTGDENLTYKLLSAIEVEQYVKASKFAQFGNLVELQELLKQESWLADVRTDEGDTLLHMLYQNFAKFSKARIVLFLEQHEELFNQLVIY